MFYIIRTKTINEWFRQLDRIETAVKLLVAGQQHMSLELDELTKEVEESTTVQEGAIKLLDNLSAQLKEIADDPAQVRALAAQLDSKGNELATAIERNTPADTEE